MKKIYLLIIAILLISITGCVEHIDVSTCEFEKTYGFWHGLWHGIIAPIDLVAMIFNDKYAVFATNNNGVWYSFGFILGSGGWGLLGAKSKKTRNNK